MPKRSGGAIYPSGLSDARTLKTFFLSIFSSILVDSLVSLYSLGLLFFIYWQLALLICGVMVLYSLWFKVITPYLQSNEQKRFIIKADFVSKMIEKIDGNQVIKSFRLEPIFSNKIRKSIKDLIDIQTRIKYIDLVNLGVISLISTVAYTLIVVVLARNSIFATNAFVRPVDYVHHVIGTGYLVRWQAYWVEPDPTGE